MSSYIVRILSPQAALACAAVLTLCACDRGAQQAQTESPTQMSWARAALERNPQIQIVASDQESGVLTIRDKNTGEVQAVKLNELAALPLSTLSALTATPAAASAAAAVQTTQAPATPATPAERAASTESASSQEQVAAATPATAASSSTEPPKNYTIERTDGKLRVSGPGISIVSSGNAAATKSTATPGQRVVEPIICEGKRMFHFDSRSIYVDGDAITVRGGCEIFITNSRIVASGTGIVVRDAIVHVSNSHIEGAFGSFDAADSSKLYVRDTTFQGVPRRTDLAMVQDQGGNRWR